jgi:small subunit ribosomal protein S1
MIDNNNSFSFGDMLKNFEKQTSIKPNTIINAMVLCLDSSSQYVIFDIYSKQEAKVSVKEFETVPQAGEVVALYVVAVNDKGEAILSRRRANKELRKKDLVEAMAKKTILPGSIVGKNYSVGGASSFNGYRVDLGDITALLPKSQIHGFDRIKDKDSFDNEKFEFLVTNIDDSRDTINVVMLDDNIKKYDFKDIAQSKIKERDVVEGVVIAIEDYGIFFVIDNQYLGFIKINDLSANKRIEHPSEIVTLGETIKAKVIKVESNRVKGSLALLDTGNLEEIASRFKIGSIYNAKITSIINHGCYVFLDDGLPVEAGKKKKRIDGFLDASEMSWNESEFYNNKFKIGDQINFKVLSIDVIITGSCKQCDMTPFDKFCQQFKENAVINVTINNCHKNKAIGEIALEDKTIISGLIDKREFHWDYNTAVSEFNKIRTGSNYQINTKIVKINKDNCHIDLSVKKIDKDPIEEFMDKYSPSSNSVEAEVTYVTDNYVLLSVDKWKNILILYKGNDSNLKLKSKVKVNIGKLDKKSKHDRHIMAFLADRNRKTKDHFNNSVADNISFDY